MDALAQKHADPADPAPDPQHCLIVLSYIIKPTTGYSTCGVVALAGDRVSTFTSFFKDKKSKRSHKTVGIKVFLTIFA